jgi:uncharacterized peroxidase-related enzyme
MQAQAKDNVAGSSPDLINSLAGALGAEVAELRGQRPDVVRFTQGSYDALLAPEDAAGVSLVERGLVALRVTVLSGSELLVAHYRAHLAQLGAPEQTVEVAAGAAANDDALDPRTTAILRHVDRVIRQPGAATQAHLSELKAAGLSTPGIVTIAQLIAFLSYQVRVLAGVLAIKDMAGSPVTSPARVAAQPRGFTLETVGWDAWLDTMDLASATAEQVAVLEESTPTAKTSPYYLLLVHDVAVLRQRSRLFNAVMYGQKGLPRAERELATVAVSMVNGCIYCASVHAQRFAQLTKKPEIIQRLFDEGFDTELEPRHRAIVDYAVKLTHAPDGVVAGDLEPLRRVGLSDLEILDLTHAVAMFAWANRLMQTLGEPVRQAS